MRVAFTPKGGCPLKRGDQALSARRIRTVAFTPKGGCPLKPALETQQTELVGL